MINQYRKLFNENFSQEKYEQFYAILKEKSGIEPKFRLSESPIFLTKEFKNQIEEASQSIINQIKNLPKEILQKAIPENCKVPNDTPKPHFFTIDFGICISADGTIEPQLIELQAFPSLYAFQQVFQETFKELYPFINELEASMSTDSYIEKFKKTIIGDESPENVVLLEIFPEKQKTEIDFVLTEQFLGIKTVCLTKVIKKGKQLFYKKNGKEIQIKRIYNRVIFDELDKIPNLNLSFDFREEVDVEWITHPNWFFKISKFLLPYLSHQFVPKSYFVPDFPAGEKLENFVLKPLFSFAGSGVNLYPTKEIINQIADPENYILQRKVNYHPLFEDINGDKSRAEIRLLYTWEPEEDYPTLMQNLVRMTKAEMVNVDFNKKDAIWIGSSHAFFEN